MKKTGIRVNEFIRRAQDRVITETGENLGILDTRTAIERAKEAGLDLVEIAPDLTPPVAKITDYGRFLYEQKKKQKRVKQQAKVVEVKTVQTTIGTGEHDLELKAKKVSEWLKEGHRIRIELFLRGRAKYMPKPFLETRLKRILSFVKEGHKITDQITSNPKGLSLVIEKV